MLGILLGTLLTDRQFHSYLWQDGFSVIGRSKENVPRKKMVVDTCARMALSIKRAWLSRKRICKKCKGVRRLGNGEGEEAVGFLQILAYRDRGLRSPEIR